MKYGLLFFSLFISTLVFSQTETTILEALQKGKTLQIEWAHQQYLSENGSIPTGYPIYPDQMKIGEGESFIGLKLEMDNCAETPCLIKVWVEYVSTVQFPVRPKKQPLSTSTTTSNNLVYPLIEDTRYVIDNYATPAFSLGSMDSIPLLVHVDTGFVGEEWVAAQEWKEAVQEAKNDLPANFSFYYLQRFLNNLWQQKWPEHGQFVPTEQFNLFDKLSVNFFKAIHPPKMTIISGQILNPVSNSIYLSGLKEGSWKNRWGQEAIKLDKDGRFNVQVPLSQATFFHFRHGFNGLQLYIEPGNNLHLDIDGNAFYRNARFSGDNAISNQFSLDFLHQLRNDDLYSAFDFNILQKNQLPYLEAIQNREKKELRFLATHQQKLNPAFFIAFDRFIRFSNARSLWLHGKYLRKPWNARFESAYLNYCQTLKKYFFRLPANQSYDFLLEEFIEFQKQVLKGPYVNQSFEFRSIQDFELAKYVLSPKNAFRYGRFLLFFGHQTGTRSNHQIYEELKTICKDSNELQELEDFNDKDLKFAPPIGMKLFASGQPAPNWAYQNESDDSTKLTDYQGKNLLLHIGLASKLAAAQKDLKELKETINLDFEVLSIIEKNGNNNEKNQPNILAISPDEMLALREKYLVDNNGNNYFLIDKEGMVVANPFNLSSFHKLKRNVANLFKEKRSSNWQPSPIFWRNLGLFTLFLLLLAGIYIQRKRILAKRELQRRQLLESELKGIRAQMNPHFLFNALSSIQNLIRKKDGQNADRYLTQFAGLVRKILRNSEKEFITLEEEIAAIQQYCSLEALRQPFDYEINISDNIDIFNTYIPGMILQPIVENAILHGLMPKTENRKLWINIEKQGDDLACEIIDNGIGMDKAKKQIQSHKIEQKSYGLQLVRQRLQLLSNSTEKAIINILDRSDLNPLNSGTIVKLMIPRER
jgi:hypothetical protein